VEMAEIVREKGTNRSKFFRGQIDKYSWVEAGSSYLPSEINAAYLWAQLEQADMVNQYRLDCWDKYYEQLKELSEKEYLELPYIPKECKHNGHMFYIKLKDLEVRTRLIDFLKERKIYAPFHYVPLHNSTAGKKYGVFNGEDRFTTKESDRLARLPMFYGLKDEEIERVTSAIKEFFNN